MVERETWIETKRYRIKSISTMLMPRRLLARDPRIHGSKTPEHTYCDELVGPIDDIIEFNVSLVQWRIINLKPSMMSVNGPMQKEMVGSQGKQHRLAEGPQRRCA